MSTILVKERGGERDWDDSRSVRTTRTAGGRTYTTVRRYVDTNTLPDEEVEDETTRIVIRERRRDDSPRDNVEYRIVHRERSASRGRDDRSERESYRIVHRRRSRSSSSSASSEHKTTVQIDREETKSVRSKHDDVVTVRERSPSVRSPYNLEKYSKSTEYFSRPEIIPIVINNKAPRPIVIREEAPRQQIILRREEPSYELVQRQRQRSRSRSSSRSSDRRRHRRDNEDYYYERRTRDYGDGRGKQVDYERERRRRRPASNDRSAYSDDDVVYIRREREVSRSNSPRDRRHIAEGAIAGIAASEIIRHRRKRNGENPGSRVGSAIGYGALGGVGAGVLSRVTRSRSRSPSWERERGRGSRRYHSRSRSRSRTRSRSKSVSKKQVVAGGVALAGLAAIAYAASKRNKNNADGDRRSRSRTRRSSVGAYSEDGRPVSTEGTAMDPKHRNQTIARVGLAGAALAGLNEARKRSQSRGREKSRIREGVPIVAAGLGSAAVAGLYENWKKKKEERTARSRSVSVGPSRTRGAAGDPALVEYGGDPIYTSEPGRRRSSARDRRDRTSSGSSPDRRRRGSRSGRSKSRDRQLAQTAAVAGVAGVAAHEATKRRERKRAERERQRQAEEAAAAGQYSPSTEAPGSYYPSTNSFPPPPMGGYDHGGYIPQHPNRSYTEPPYPTQGGPAAYNPASWGPTTGPTLPQEEAYHQEPYAAARGGDEGHGHDYYRGHPHDPNNVSAPLSAVGSAREIPLEIHSRSVSRERERNMHSPDGLISHPDTNKGIDEDETPSLVDSRSSTPTTATNANKNVHFNLSPETLSPVYTRRGYESEPEPDTSREQRRRRKRRHHHSRDDHDRSSRSSRDDRSNGSDRRRHRRAPHSPTASDDSGDTIEDPELVDRFDEEGRPKRTPRGKDPFADAIDDIKTGKGPFANLVGRMTDGFFGGGHKGH